MPFHSLCFELDPLLGTCLGAARMKALQAPSSCSDVEKLRLVCQTCASTCSSVIGILYSSIVRHTGGEIYTPLRLLLAIYIEVTCFRCFLLHNPPLAVMVDDSTDLPPSRAWEGFG